MKSIKKIMAILALFVFVVLYALNAAATQPPAMQLRVGIPKAMLWSEPTSNCKAVKDENNKSVSLACGEIVYETTDQFGRSDYGDFLSVEDTKGNKGYVYKKYLIYGYKIRLEGNSSVDIYRTEWAAVNGDQGIGSVVANRKAEELLVIGETKDCLQVLTVSEPKCVSGYISKYSYFSYVYDMTN